jgi:hypothetical protein
MREIGSEKVGFEKKKIGIHLTVYELNDFLNEILFEIFYLGVVNYNNESFLIIPENAEIFIEVANIF